MNKVRLLLKSYFIIYMENGLSSFPKQYIFKTETHIIISHSAVRKDNILAIIVVIIIIIRSVDVVDIFLDRQGDDIL